MRPPTDTEMQAVMKSLNEARNHLDLLTFDAPQEFRKALYPLHDCIEGLEMAQKGETCMTLETYPQRYVDALNAEIAMLRDKLAGYEIPHDKREPRCQAVGSDAEGKVPTTALTEQRVSREAIRPPGSGADELEYWRANAMHYHGLCVALEDEIDCWNLALDGKNAYIRRHTEWLEKANDELRDLHTTLSAFTNCASDGRNWRMMWQRLCEQREALRAKAEEYREGWVKCCFNASDAHTLNRRMREFLHAYFIDGVLRFGERDGKPWTYREEARELLEIELPELEQAPTREGGGGGGSENPSPAEEKYNA